MDQQNTAQVVSTLILRCDTTG